ncbi:MAG: tetratricopeptide repeat protein [Candidatus Omnitrophica bacterium]|nr:tetratricopeptide repeat protein [Candidatus Omnitrophota bacterium]
MKKLTAVLTLSVFILSACAAGEPAKNAPLSDQEERWLKMTDDAVTLYTQHKHKEAIELAREALALAEETFGKEHPNVAESLDNLATYLAAEGEYKEAEALYQQALSIIEKSFPESEYLAIFLNYLADFYTKTGKPDEAAKLEQRANELRVKIR